MSTEIKPWRKARQLVHLNLYWLPVRAFPYPSAERDWVFRFIAEFNSQVARLFNLEPEFIIRGSALSGPRQEKFAAVGRKHFPIAGLCRNPDEPIKRTPTLEDLQPVQRNEKEFRMSDYTPEYCYWFSARLVADAMRDFGGLGGAYLVFHPPDPGSLPPDMPPIQAFAGDPHLGPEQLQSYMRVVSALRAAFLPKTKAVFGKGLESDPRFEQIPFVVPRWNAQIYVGARPELVTAWLSVFPIQVVESADDGGLLLASVHPLDDLLVSITASLERDGLVFHGSTP